MAISVAIVEDDADIRARLARAVERAAGLRFVGSFPDGEAALDRMPVLAPNVVIMDLQLPGMSGIECTRRVRRTMPTTQVLVFTAFGDSERVFKALEAGASGYLLKRSTRREIIEAIEEVWDGGAPMTGEIALKVVESFRKPPRVTPSAHAQLSAREEEVLQLLAKGYQTKEIADALSISYFTVRFHLKRIYTKLHVRSKTEALLRYLQ
jgi:DNA-binding NarL/FixJ family response regulator